MTNHAWVAGGIVSIVVALTACASAPDEQTDHADQEKVAKTDEALMMQEGGGGGTYEQTSYSCDVGGACYISNGQCMCKSNCWESGGTWYCYYSYGWTYYAWNPCSYPQSLYCNSYGTCWCQ